MNKLGHYASALTLWVVTATAHAVDVTATFSSDINGGGAVATMTGTATGTLVGDILTLSGTARYVYVAPETSEVDLGLSADFDFSGPPSGTGSLTSCNLISGFDVCATLPALPTSPSAFDSVTGTAYLFTTTNGPESIDWVVTEVIEQPPAPPGPDGSTANPTMSTYGLVLTILGLLLVAARRLRASAKRS